ncbi:hypothetical protein UA08_02236 [Talaromyces atroroseus]|uniref:NmrA-like domain-containing protein n=1 Tax=Talaromyces atroroseus TaxID=1441469 RepID=A0A225AM33_TALAT|nr:hypothetical protein UA08_02236 [Talaromyces atroroseus]OKL61950.1 hypothetical protein UA08_02236 [Talaromyces atroroseus]
MTTTETKKIGVFPASGKFGGCTIKHLLPLVPAANLILISRKPEKLAEHSRLGAVIRYADYEDDTSFQRAFDGVGILFLMSYPSCEHEYRSRAHQKAIDAARHSGVKHIFYSSLAFAGNLTKTTAAFIMRANLDTEAYLDEQGRTHGPDFTYTILRQGLYHESFPLYLSFFDLHKTRDTENTVIKIPHDGFAPGVAWAKREELAEATAKIIGLYARNPLGFPFTNSTVLFSGPRVLTLRDVIDVLVKITGRDEKINIKEVSIDEYASQPHIGPLMTYHGVDLSREWATAWQAIRNGECAVVTPVLKEILGREPQDFETTMRNEFGGRN